MGPNGGLYKALLLLHILAVVVGFGPLVLNGLYGAQAKKRQGEGGLAIGEANHFVSEVAEKLVYAVPVLGILLVLVSDGQIEFSETWISASFVLYIIGIGISHGVMRPSSKRMLGLSRDLLSSGPSAGGPPPQMAEMEKLGKKLAAGGMVLNLLLVVIIGLMIWQPGRGV
ncbi:MAG: hypothetical protein AVDCRST_MAG50-2627 [uncultured Acidimicrobiales bacterium]|uniref:DUF2269 family protein n=1 Tax=uncultured Acidimicrobiales bacterium TaxID=310071 RepID=A0A6J4ILZ5_9ACTN|nr:MAG: hypothetical protein AVDCRST_MAG50-2627 [uncultured Acidimicrobiales bacterium]